MVVICRAARIRTREQSKVPQMLNARLCSLIRSHLHRAESEQGTAALVCRTATKAPCGALHVGKRAWIADRNRPQFMASFVPVNNRVVWR